MATIDQLVANVRRQQSDLARQRLQLWAEVCSLWEQCFVAEGLDPAAPVVTFSPDNPYLEKYARRWQATSEHAAALRARSAA